MERERHFFKVLIGDFSDGLRIPPDFVKHVAKGAYQGATLKCPNGQIWRVKLRKQTGGIFLKSGWQEFVNAHSLQEFDVLVFRYDGDVLFTVQIYDRSACEREDVCTSETAPESVSYNKRKKRGRGKCSSDSSKIPHHKALKGGETENLCVHGPPQSSSGGGDNRVDCTLGVAGPRTPPKFDGVLKIKTEDVEQPTSSPASVSCTKSVACSLTRKQLSTQEASKRACKKANSFTSKFHYFVLRLKDAHLGEKAGVNVPVSFCRRQHIREPVKISMLFRGPDRRPCEVNCTFSEKRGYFAGGWKGFSRSHNLKAGDLCVFERVGEMEMQVHFFRVADEITL